MWRPYGIALLPTVLLAGCAGFGGSNDGKSAGVKALEAARAKARAARYVVESSEGGYRMQRFPALTVIYHRGRISNWSRRDVEYTARRRKRCYERHREFLYADVLEVRRSIGAPEAEPAEASVATVRGQKVVRWRNDPDEEGFALEGEVYLDKWGRPIEDRVRQWSPAPPGDPNTWPKPRRYSYPVNLAKPRPPEPLCSPTRGTQLDG